MLSLNISSTYNNIPYKRLLYILRSKGFLKQIIQFIQDFISQKETLLVFNGYQSPLIIIATGIPQKSPFLPILFLFFINNLFNIFKKRVTQRIEFIDNINLIIYGPIAVKNCRTLKKAYNACIKQVKQYRVQFLLEKYQQKIYQRSILRRYL